MSEPMPKHFHPVVLKYDPIAFNVAHPDAFRMLFGRDEMLDSQIKIIQNALIKKLEREFFE